MIRFVLLFALALLARPAESWKTCGEQPFCSNIRSSSSPNHFGVATWTASETDFNAQVVDNDDANKNLFLEVVGFADETFRVTITDLQHKRYHNQDAVLPQVPVALRIDLYETFAFVRNGKSRLVIQKNPLVIQGLNEFGEFINIGAKRMEYNTGADNQALALDFSFLQAETLYGIPEHAERLSLVSTTGGQNSEPYRLYNLDFCCYPLETREALYGAIPVLYGHGSTQSSGIFWMNTAQTFVDVGYVSGSSDALIISESGVMEFFVLPGPSLRDAVKQYHSLTGTAPQPPYFSLGYHQSRWSYMSQNELETVVDELDKNDFPLDVMWLDIDYTVDKKYFTWNLDAFPDPVGMQEKLNATGRQLVVIIDPHIKVEEGYFVYDQGKANNYFVKNVDGSNFEGDCWPGLSSYIDFTNPSAMSWYEKLYENFDYTTDIVHIWNDMNEPSVFDDSLEKTFPPEVLHYNNWPHRDLHNTYGYYQTKGTYNALVNKYHGRRRPFILTRSHFAGSQRYTAVWTGDNVASWEHLKITIPMCLTEGLAGVSFCGADVGGFVENAEDELLQRWYQLGAWMPFYRAHCAQDVTHREPYLYPADIQARFRFAMRQRYQHMPYWYTQFFLHGLNNEPVMRPMSYNYERETALFSNDVQFMVGTDILVAPVLDKDATTLTVRLPHQLQHNWYDVDNQLMYESGDYSLAVTLDSVPVFYRGGSIVARHDEPRPSSQLTVEDPFTLYIFLDYIGQARGYLYLDDRTTFNYQNKQYFFMEFQYEQEMLTWHVVPGHENADYDGHWWVNHALIYRPPRNAARADGQPVAAELVEKRDLNIDLRKSSQIKLGV